MNTGCRFWESLSGGRLHRRLSRPAHGASCFITRKVGRLHILRLAARFDRVASSQFQCAADHSEVGRFGSFGAIHFEQRQLVENLEFGISDIYKPQPTVALTLGGVSLPQVDPGRDDLSSEEVMDLKFKNEDDFRARTTSRSRYNMLGAV